MKKLLIIGNSHLAALRNALNEVGEPSDVDISFLARGGVGLASKLCVNNGVLSGVDKGSTYLIYRITGKRELILNDYDLIIVYGCQLMTSAHGQLWIDHMMDAMSGRYSEGSLKTAHINDIESSENFEILEKIFSDQVYKGRLLAIPSPLPSEKYSGFKVKGIKVKDNYLNEIEALYKRFLNEKGVEFYPMPSVFRAKNNYSTSKKFRNMKFFKEGFNKDFSHLNVKGGKVLLEAILRDLV